MIIVCTQDSRIVDWTFNAQSGATQWGNALQIPIGSTQKRATSLLGEALQFLGVNEPLCLNCHGTDTEIGDESSGRKDWTWNVNDIAAILIKHAPNGYKGPILIKSCATHVTNFSARLAVCLQNGRALNGVWIFGYNLAISVNQSFPDPTTLDKQADLQGTQVNY